MQRLWLILALLLAAGTCGARTDAYYVPLSITPANLPLVTVKIGTQQLPLMFDLGGNGQLALSPAALQGLQVEPLASDEQWVDASGRRIEAKRFRVAELQVGPLIFHNVIGYEDIDAPGYRKSPAGVGHFGAPLLKGFKVLLDYKRQEMFLIPVNSSYAERAGCAGRALPYLSQYQGEPVTTIGTDLGDLTMAWDTGAAVSLVQRSKATAAASQEGLYRAHKFVVGGLDMGPVDMKLLDFTGPPGLDGFVGYNFLVKNRVCVDPAGKQLLVQRAR
jgi:hypothetical protein